VALLILVGKIVVKARGGARGRLPIADEGAWSLRRLRRGDLAGGGTPPASRHPD
jgi:hypothetical protein